MGGFGPPGGQQDVNTTLPLVLGIVSIFCCWPAAIGSIILAVQASNALQIGDIEGARQKAKTSKTISFVVIGLWLAFWVVYFLLMILGVAFSAANS
jgi:Interferon-induced transmembrane protein